MVEVLGNLGVGLGVAVVQLVAIVLAQRLGVDAHQRSYLGLWDAIAGQRFDLAALHVVGLVSGAGHQSSPLSRKLASWRPVATTTPFGYLSATRALASEIASSTRVFV